MMLKFFKKGSIVIGSAGAGRAYKIIPVSLIKNAWDSDYVEAYQLYKYLEVKTSFEQWWSELMSLGIEEGEEYKNLGNQYILSISTIKKHLTNTF